MQVESRIFEVKPVKGEFPDPWYGNNWNLYTIKIRGISGSMIVIIGQERKKTTKSREWWYQTYSENSEYLANLSCEDEITSPAKRDSIVEFLQRNFKHIEQTVPL